MPSTPVVPAEPDTAAMPLIQTEPLQHLRVVTYNIHKGVQGMWPLRRLEIHNLQQAIADLQADVICL